MSCNNLYGFDFLIYATIISLLLAKDLSSPEQDLLGNFFIVLGQNLTTLAAYKNDTEEICELTND